jgi:hypothetical protein
MQKNWNLVVIVKDGCRVCLKVEEEKQEAKGKVN